MIPPSLMNMVAASTVAVLVHAGAAPGVEIPGGDTPSPRVVAHSGITYRVGTGPGRVPVGQYWSSGLLPGSTRCEWSTTNPHGGDFSRTPAGGSMLIVRPGDLTVISHGCTDWVTPIPPDIAAQDQELGEALDPLICDTWREAARNDARHHGRPSTVPDQCTDNGTTPVPHQP